MVCDDGKHEGGVAEIATDYKFRKFDHHATLTVKFILTREYKVRKIIATALIKLAASILGCGIKFD